VGGGTAEVTIGVGEGAGVGVREEEGWREGPGAHPPSLPGREDEGVKREGASWPKLVPKIRREPRGEDRGEAGPPGAKGQGGRAPT
jgi:hypothetical protein